jgi:hypothetical protein
MSFRILVRRAMRVFRQFGRDRERVPVRRPVLYWVVGSRGLLVTHDLRSSHAIPPAWGGSITGATHRTPQEPGGLCSPGTSIAPEKDTFRGRGVEPRCVPPSVPRFPPTFFSASEAVGGGFFITTETERTGSNDPALSHSQD